MKPLILASTSPRRRQILGYFKLPFEIISPTFDEEAVPYETDPVVYAHRLSVGKAESVRKELPDRLILTADTVVFKDGRYFAKPRDRKEAKEFLQILSGQWHTVITSLTMVQGPRLYQEHGHTRVLFNPLSPLMIEKYLDTNEWTDKAGGYAIQGSPSLCIKRIEGCFYNAMGLPLNPLTSLLTRFDIDLWQYL